MFGFLLALSSAWAGPGFSTESPLQLFEHQLSMEWKEAANWPDLVVLESGNDEFGDGQGAAFLVLEVNDQAKCWDHEQGRLRPDQLDETAALDPDQACLVTAIKRLETEAAWPLEAGAYTQTRLAVVSAQSVVAWLSAADGIAWMARQDAWPGTDSGRVDAEALLHSAAVISGGDQSHMAWLESGYNLAYTSPSRAVPLSQVFSETFSHLTSGPIVASCEAGCTAGGPGAHACSCARAGSSCGAVCGAGHACCTCRGMDFPGSACCADPADGATMPATTSTGNAQGNLQELQ